MIRHETDDGAVWLFTQNTHAFLCGQFARRWNLTPLQLIDELLIAAALHDIGWVERDSEPQINAAGKPRTFTELDLDDHFTVWRRSIERVSAVNRYSGLLVSLHCADLYRRRLKSGIDSPEDRTRIEHFLENQLHFQKSVQAELIPHYGEWAETDYLTHNRELLQAWDWMSLMLFMGNAQNTHPVKIGSGQTLTLSMDTAGILHITPRIFPQTVLTFTAEGRRLDRTTFENDDELRQAYHAAPLQRRPFQVKLES